MAGNYSLTSSFIYHGLTNDIKITTYKAGSTNVNIFCKGTNTGLTFIDCIQSVEISDLKFYNCGTLHNSTTVSAVRKMSDGTREYRYVEFYATLFFAFCSGGVKLNKNVISQSKGIAAQLYSIGSKVTIELNQFVDNPYPSTSANGGGLYIEFINCSQLVNFDICESYPTYQGISGATYEINNNHFINNTAAKNQTNSVSYTYPNNSNYVSFGRGGGLSVCLRGSSTHNTFYIEGNTFSNNYAVFGGGLLLEFRNNASSNTLHVSSCSFNNNTAKYAGGGMRLSMFSSWQGSDGQVINNRISLYNTTYANNLAEWGGGLSVEVSKVWYKWINEVNSIYLNGITCTGNTGRLGAGIDLTRSYNHPEDTGVLPNITLSNCTFNKNSVSYNKMVLGYGALYADSVPITLKDEVTFSHNDGAGIVTVDNTISFASGCQAIFYANKARDGAGITIFAFSTLIIDRNTLLNFTSNIASNEGGAIFAFRAGGRNLRSSRDCFLRYIDPAEDPQKWDTRLVFDSNKASGDDNSIFTTSIEPCLWGRDTNISKLIQDALCWNSTFFYEPTSCNHQVTTDPASIIKVEPVLKVYPGIKKNLNILAYNDEQTIVTKFLSVTANSDNDQIIIDSRSKYITSNTILLRKSVTTSSKCVNNETYTGNLTLESGGPRVITATLFVKLLPCPPGFTLENATSTEDNSCECNCADGKYYNLISCENNEASILRGYWIGNTTDGSIRAGICIYCNYTSSHLDRIMLEQNSSETEWLLCDENRSGVLCGNCENGSAPNFNSLSDTKCVECEKAKPSSWLLFIFLRIIVPFTLFIVLFFLQFSVSSGYLNGPIFFAQMATSVLPITGPLNAMISPVVRNTLRTCFYTVYEIWNLNFCSTCFETPCLHPNLSITDILLMEYGIAFLPLLLVLFFKFIDLLRYFKEKPIIVDLTRSKLFKLLTPKEAIRNALIAAIILSYNKIAVLTGYLLCPTPLFKENAGTDQHYYENVQYVLYVNGSITFMGHEHRKFAYPVMFISGIFLFLIPFILLLYRYENIEKNDGFFNHLFNLIQSDFRSGAQDKTNADNNQLAIDQQHSIQNRMFRSTETVAPEPSEYHISVHRCCINYEDNISATRKYKCWPPFCSLRVKVYHGSIRFHTAWGYNEYRWVPALYFFARLGFISMYMFGASTMAIINLQAALSLFIAGFFLVFRPYIKQIHNNIDGMIFLLIGMVLSLESYRYYKSASHLQNYIFVYVIEDILLAIPFLWITGYILYKIYAACKKNKRRRRGHNADNITDINTENQPLITTARTENTVDDD